MLPLHWEAVAKMAQEIVVFILADVPQAPQELLYL